MVAPLDCAVGLKEDPDEKAASAWTEPIVTA